MSSLKTIKTVVNGDRTVLVRWCKESKEYVNQLQVNGIYRAGADYYCDCKQDAFGTAERMAMPIETTNAILGDILEQIVAIVRRNPNNDVAVELYRSILMPNGVNSENTLF